MSIREIFGKRSRESESPNSVYDVISKNDRIGFIFILPNLVVFTVFLLLPVLASIYLSFTEWNAITGGATWVGLENYLSLLAEPYPWANNWAVLSNPIASLWWHSVLQTLKFSLGVVPLSILGGLSIALLLDKKLRGEQALQAMYFMPVMLSGAISAVVWRYALSLHGTVNDFLRPLGLAYNWAGEPATALYSIMLVSIWAGIGFNMVIFLSGLQNIPEELYDAARVDGASGWTRFRHVTWPNLQTIYFFVIVLSIISSFQVFGIAMSWQDGGPFHATTVIVVRIYKTAFSQGEFGLASAMAVMLLLMIFSFSYYQFRTRGTQEVGY